MVRLVLHTSLLSAHPTIFRLEPCSFVVFGSTAYCFEQLQSLLSFSVRRWSRSPSARFAPEAHGYIVEWVRLCRPTALLH